MLIRLKTVDNKSSIIKKYFLCSFQLSLDVLDVRLGFHS